MSLHILRQTIFDIWAEHRQSTAIFDAVLAYILQEFGDVSNDALKSMRATIRSLCQQIKLQWRKVGRHHKRFLKENYSWLQESLTFSDIVIQTLPHKAVLLLGMEDL